MLRRAILTGLLVFMTGLCAVVPRWILPPKLEDIPFSPVGWGESSKRKTPEHFVLAAVETTRLEMLESVQGDVLHVGMSSEDLCALLGPTDSHNPRCGYDSNDRSIYRYWIGQYWRDPSSGNLIGPHELWLEVYFKPDGTVTEWAEYWEEIFMTL